MEVDIELDSREEKPETIAYIFLGGIAAFYLLFPGLVSWVNDEPILVLKAMLANHEGYLATSGLDGSFGVTYSPIVVWLYQAFLLLTDHVTIMILMKTALSVGGILISGLGIARLLKLPVWPLILPFCAPHFWHSQRVLWDNCFLVPISSCLIWAMLAFWKEPRWLPAACAAVCSVVMFHIHLMSLMVIGPTVLVTIICQKRWFIQKWYRGVTVFVGAAALCTPYLIFLSRQVVERHALHGKGEGWSFLLHGFYGFGVFTHWAYQDMLPYLYQQGGLLPSWFVWGLLAINCCLLPIAGYGAVGPVISLYRTVKKKQRLDLHNYLTIWAMSVIGAMFVFFSFTRAQGLSHYFNASWFAYFYFLWVGCRRIGGTRLIRPFPMTLVVSGVAFLVVVVFHISITGGNRTLKYGTCLGNQIVVARAVAPFSQSGPIDRHVRGYERFPMALNALIALEIKSGRAVIEKDRRTHYRIEYAVPDNPHSGWIRVVEVESGQP